MCRVIGRSLFGRIAIACALAFPTLTSVQGASNRLALVIGNSNYSGFTALPACIPSAARIAEALRRADFQVIERKDLTRGGLASGINEFAKGMESTPDASVVLYVCGYAAGMNDRAFVLPVSAAIERPSDVMTQGVLAKSLLDLLVRGRPSRGLLVLDLAVPAEMPPPTLGPLSEVSAPETLGFIAVVGSQPDMGPTALATSIASGIADPSVDTAALLGRAEANLRRISSAKVAALRVPLVPRLLAAAEPSHASPPQTPEPRQAPTPAPPAEAAATPVPRLALPDERDMTVTERRLVQEALTRLGYYGAKVDGVFGPETRAAIRRFQHEIGTNQTGFITGEEAVRLLTLR